MATRYAFKHPSLETYGDAQLAGEHLDALIDEKKEHCTAEEIVADARKNQSPIHDFFTWDDAMAADKWRKREAHLLTGALVLAKGKKKTKTKAFVYVHHPEHHGKKVLMTLRTAMTRPDMREELIEKAVKSLKHSLSYWGGAYGGNQELAALARDVDALRKRIEQEFGLATA